MQFHNNILEATEDYLLVMIPNSHTFVQKNNQMKPTSTCVIVAPDKTALLTSPHHSPINVTRCKMPFCNSPH